MDRETIAHELEQSLGPEYISTINQHAYIEGHRIISLANRIFGFDGWSSEITNMEQDFHTVSSGRHTMGINCTMRVTLANGSHREDVGYGTAVNMPSRHQASEKARKEASTDALKRAMRQFGEALGNCIYNKEHTAFVSRVKPEKLPISMEDMRRPQKRIKSETNDELGPEEAKQEEPKPKKLTSGPLINPNPIKPSAATATAPAATATAATATATATAAATASTVNPLSNQAPATPAPSATSIPKASLIKKVDLPEEPAITTDSPKFPDPVFSDEDQSSQRYLEDLSFVTADNADLVGRRNTSTPLPNEALFDPLASSGIKGTLAQNKSAPVHKK